MFAQVKVEYDIDATGTPAFTRILERSQDSLLRSTGWDLKQGNPLVSEHSVGYSYDMEKGSGRDLLHLTLTETFSPK